MCTCKKNTLKEFYNNTLLILLASNSTSGGKNQVEKNAKTNGNLRLIHLPSQTYSQTNEL